MKNWIVTVPKTIPWVEYMREVNAAWTKEHSLFFKVPHKTPVCRGDRVYRVYDGRVRGYILAQGVHYNETGFECRHSGRRWSAGWYVECKGPWHPVECGPLMRGFRGVRRYQNPPGEGVRDVEDRRWIQGMLRKPGEKLPPEQV